MPPLKAAETEINMALVKCPDCNERVSSTAEKCVHCGCSLSVCPDCGKVSPGGTDFCSSCGFNFKKAEKKKRVGAFKEFLDYWKANRPGDSLFSRIIPIIFAVMGVAFITFAVMAVTNVLRLGYNDDCEKIFKIGISVTVSVIFSVIFFILLIASSILHFAFVPYKCGAFIRDNEIDITDSAARLKELPKSKRTSKNNREIRAFYVSEFPRELSDAVKIRSICGVFYIVSLIIACVFLNEGINEFMVLKAFSDAEATLIGTVDWILLLIPGGIIVITLAVDIIAAVMFRRNISRWLGYPEAKPEAPKSAPAENASPLSGANADSAEPTEHSAEAKETAAPTESEETAAPAETEEADPHAEASETVPPADEPTSDIPEESPTASGEALSAEDSEPSEEDTHAEQISDNAEGDTEAESEEAAEDSLDEASEKAEAKSDAEE